MKVYVHTHHDELFTYANKSKIHVHYMRTHTSVVCIPNAYYMFDINKNE